MPIILINGGPGAPHNYLLPMKVDDEEGDGDVDDDGDDDGGGDSGGGGDETIFLLQKVLACSGRKVIFYDQARSPMASYY